MSLNGGSLGGEIKASSRELLLFGGKGRGCWEAVRGGGRSMTLEVVTAGHSQAGECGTYATEFQFYFYFDPFEA